MKIAISTIFLILGCSAIAQPTKEGKWLDTTEDTKSQPLRFFSDSEKLLLTEDFEVLKTHEVCASVRGFFFEKSQLGRYEVNFKGMSTSAIFTFTTQYDAEAMVEKFCTAESFTSIKNGPAAILKRNY